MNTRDSIQLCGKNEGDVIVVHTFTGKMYLGKLAASESVIAEHSGCKCSPKETITLSDCVELREMVGSHGQIGVGIAEATPLIKEEFNLEFPVEVVLAAGTPVDAMMEMYLKALEAKRAQESGLILGTSKREQSMFGQPSSSRHFNA